jgi:catechol 2,3-dioxygenase-like lactoylglutathione lyase family enzyme
VPAELSALDHFNLAIRGSSIEDVAAYLRSNGAEIIRGPEEGRAGPTVNVRDPDGHVIEIRMVGPS